jgi:hypothetical protein
MGGTLVASADVEARLRTIPRVIDAALAEHRDRRGHVSLVAHLQVRPEAPEQSTAADDSISLGAIRQQLLGRVPTSQIPVRVTAALTLPRHADGTLDRQGLPSPFAADEARLASAEPRGDAEQLMADVWRDVLGISVVGRDDNFFGLGGTSLLCFRAIERVRERVGVRLSPRALLVGSLAQAAAGLSLGSDNVTT